MNDIDDLMRQKFEADIPAERFVFREEYWEQARALLEKADREKRRRRLLFLLLSSASLLGLAGFFVNKYLPTKGKDVPEQVQIAQTTIEAEKTAPLALSKQPDNPLENTVPSASSVYPTIEKQVPVSEAGATKTNHDAPMAVAAPPPPPSAVALLTTPTISARLPIPAPEAQSALTGTDLIAVLCKPLTLPTLKQTPPNTHILEAPQTTKTTTKKRLAMNLVLAMAGYHYPPADTSMRNVGWVVGTMAEYKMSDKFALTTSLQWRIAPGYSVFSTDSSAPAPKLSEVITYSFGFNRHKWEYQTKALHFVEIPIGFQWTPSKWVLEAGGSINILARVQNIEHYTLSTSLDQIIAERSATKNGIKNLYTQLGYGTYAGIGYQLGKRATGFLRGQYRLSPIFAPEAELPADDHLITFDFGLRYRFW